MKRVIVMVVWACLAWPAMAEPIRITGAVSGRGEITLRVGDGVRETKAFAKTLARPFPIELPSSPSRWRTVAVRNGRFVTDWIESDPPPQIVAFDTSGGVAVQDVAIAAAVRSNETIDVGTVVLRPAPVLDVHVTMPAAAAAGVLLDINAIEAGDADRAAAGRRLAVLDQIDRRLFDLFVLRRPYDLGTGGAASLRWLPPLRSMRAVLSMPHGSGRTTHDVQFDAAGHAAIDTTLETIAGRPAKRRAVAGTLRLEETNAPAGGAKVVLSDGIERHETTADTAGHFTFEDVPDGAPLTIFADAANAPPAHKRTTVFRQVDPSGDMALTIPRAVKSFVMPAMDLPPSLAQCEVPDTDDPYPFILAYFCPSPGNCGVALDSVEFSAITQAGEGLQFDAMVPQEGVWFFYVALTPFLEVTTQSGQAPANTQFTVQFPIPQFQPSVHFNFSYAVPRGSHPLNNWEIEFAPPENTAEWLGSIAMETSKDGGDFAINCVNIWPLSIFVNSPFGGCAGYLGGAIGDQCTITLTKGEDLTCVCKSGR